MTTAKLIASGLCAASFFCTLLCMLLSAAGLREETRSVFWLTLLLAAAGFAAARYAKLREKALRRATTVPHSARALMNDAIAALQVLEQFETSESRADFQQKAAAALMALGNIHATKREHAVTAAAQAIALQHALRTACESGEESTAAALRTKAAAQAELAIRAIRDLI